MTVGENIRRIRKEKGLTQKQLGELCGIKEANIRKYELGGANPKFETLSKIAKALGTHPLVLNGSISEEHAQSLLTHVDPETAFTSLVRTFYGYVDERQVHMEGSGNSYYYAIGTDGLVLSQGQFDDMFDEVEKLIRNYVTIHGHSEKEEIDICVKVLNDFKECDGDFQKLFAKLHEYIQNQDSNTAPEE